MEEAYFLDETFEKINNTETSLQFGEYEGCIFQNCDLSNAILVDFKFTDCIFIGCNLSLAKLNKSAFRNVEFVDCKLLGLHFDTCNKFGLSLKFERCILNHSSFYQTTLKATSFVDVELQEVDFTECDLKQAVFYDCNLLNATFENTNLEEVDFRNAHNYCFDPEVNMVKNAKFSVNGLAGLLNKFNIIIEG